MDESEENDIILKVNNPHIISENIVGENLNNFNSCLVLSHFKGHGMGGFGGALKQLSIGFASRAGKAYIHTAGKTKDYKELWSKVATQLDFTAAMADAASTIVNYFKNKGGIAYINVLANISKSCDCTGIRAAEPRIRNIGILASIDPVAIDKACYDLIAKENNPGSQEWIKQSESKFGLNTLNKAVEHELGSLEYNLIDIDNEYNESIPISYTNKNNSEAKRLSNEDPKNDNDKKYDNSFKKVLFSVTFISIILIIMIAIIYNVKRRKKGNLVANEDLGQSSSPEEKV